MKTRIHELIHSNGLSRHAGAIQRFMKDEINLQPLRAEGEQVGVGRSKLGGLPDLPPTMDWPVWKGQPLSFIGQFNMAEVVPFDSDKSLPQTGFLYVFYEANEQSVWGFDPGDRGAWRILYFDGPASELARRTKPPFETSGSVPKAQFNECPIEFSKGVSLPGSVSSVVDTLKLTEQEHENYSEFLEDVAELFGDGPAYHHFLGYPQQIQGEMELECQLVSHGLYCGDASGYENSGRSQLEDGTKDWRLLLQVDSDEDVGMMWGDVGRIYFWIRHDDLKARNFENVWFVLQCY